MLGFGPIGCCPIGALPAVAAGGGTTATNEPFYPTGTTGQLAIGGTNVASAANVTHLKRTNWQGELTLSQSSRTNLLRGSVWSGGSPPTEWTIFQAGTGSVAAATSTLDTSLGATALLFTCTNGAREFIYETVTLAAGQQYILSVWVESAPAGVLAPSDIFSYGTSPGDEVVTYPVCPANPSGGQGGVLTTGRLDILISSGAGGSFAPRIGLGASGTLDGVAVRLSHPQMEQGTAAGSWIPTTTAAASVTDYSYTGAGAVTLGQTASGTYTWSGSGVLESGSALNIPDTTPAAAALTGLGSDGLTKALADAAPAAMALTGLTGTLSTAFPDSTPAALALTGTTGDGTTKALADAGPGTLTLLGLAATILITIADVAPAVLGLTGYAGTVLTGIAVQDTTAAALALTGLAGGGVAVGVADAAPSSLALTGLAGTVSKSIGDGTPGALVLTGQTGDTFSRAVADAAPSALAITGYAGSVQIPVVIPDVAPAALAITGLAGSLAAQHADAPPASCITNGLAGQARISLSDAPPASITLVGHAGDVTIQAAISGIPRSAALPERTYTALLPARTFSVQLPPRSYTAILYPRTFTAAIQGDAMQQFDPAVPAAPGEILPLKMDFSRELPAGATIASCPWTCEVYEGTDSAPADVLQGYSPVIDGAVVEHRVHFTVDNITYLFRGAATLSTGDVIHGRVLQRVATRT